MDLGHDSIGVTHGMTKYRPDLDGLRGLAILLVLIEHTAIIGSSYLLDVAPAMVGVTTFFVLSGYLITGLLLRESQIDLRHFYLRRVSRLGPALLLLIAAVVGAATLHLNPFPWWPGVVSSLLYVSNWSNIAGIPTGLLGHTWSLAIEEQFYLLWPVTMILLPRRFLMPLSIVLAVGGCLMYALNVGPVYYSSFTNGGAILAGCAAALAGRVLPRNAGLLGVALIVVGAVGWSQMLAVIGAVLVVLAPIDALLPLAPLGRRAYSLYLWSWPIVLLAGGPAALPLTLIAAELSYRLVERPVINRYHARFASRGPQLAVPRFVPAESIWGQAETSS